MSEVVNSNKVPVRSKRCEVFVIVTRDSIVKAKGEADTVPLDPVGQQHTVGL